MTGAGKLALGLAALSGGFVAISLVRGRRAYADAPSNSDAAPVPRAPTPARGRAAVHVGQPQAPYIPGPPPAAYGGYVTYQFPPSGNADLDAYRKRHAPDETAPALIQWDPILIAMCALHGVPFPFARAYVAAESGGNPCAVGELAATGPDGSPKEIGLFQIYNPDDFKAIGIAPSRLVAYCVRPAPGQNNPQRLSRPMTADEMSEHIGAGISNILRHKAKTDHILAATGYSWTPDSPDYWSAVKLVHALPVEEDPGFAQVKAHLGHAPASWREFRTAYEAIQPRARFNAAKGDHQDGFFRALDNAEWTGAHVQPAAAIA